MKTKAQIKKKMEDLRPFTTLAPQKKEFDNLKTCLYYLESGVTEETLKKQLDDVRKKLIIYSDRFQAWLTSNRNLFSDEREATKFYENKNEMPRLRKQVETLEYLID